MKTKLDEILLVYSLFLWSFALGVWLVLKNFITAKAKVENNFQQDFKNNTIIYYALWYSLVVFCILYFYLTYKYNGLYPFCNNPWNFESVRNYPLFVYPSITHSIVRTLPFIIFAVGWCTKNKIVRIISICVFLYGFFLITKRSSLLTITILLYLFTIIYNKIRLFSKKTFLIGLSFLLCFFFSLHQMPKGDQVITRLCNSNIGDILAITYFDGKPQGFKYIKNFINKGLRDRKIRTFAEEWNSILVNGKTNSSYGIGCISACFVNFGLGGAGLMFLFGYAVGWLEIFFEKRKDLLCFWISLYCILCFQIGNIFVISFLSSLVKGGLIVTLPLCALGFCLEKRVLGKKCVE